MAPNITTVYGKRLLKHVITITSKPSKINVNQRNYPKNKETRQKPLNIKSNLSLYSLYYTEACNEFARHISASLRPGSTARFEEMLQRWRTVDNTVSQFNQPETWTSNLPLQRRMRYRSKTGRYKMALYVTEKKRSALNCVLVKLIIYQFILGYVSTLTSSGADLCWALGGDNLQFYPILPYFQH